MAEITASSTEAVDVRRVRVLQADGRGANADIASGCHHFRQRPATSVGSGQKGEVIVGYRRWAAAD